MSDVQQDYCNYGCYVRNYHFYNGEAENDEPLTFREWNGKSLFCLLNIDFSFFLIGVSVMIVEFRIPLPYCLENPMIGYRYMNFKACESATGGGEGVEWLVEEEYFYTFR